MTSLLHKTDINGVYNVLFSRKPRSHLKNSYGDFIQTDELSYECLLSKAIPMPKIVNDTKTLIEGNNVAFTIYGDIAPYNRYYTGSSVSFNHIHDALRDRTGTYHSKHLYLHKYAHIYRMPIIHKGEDFIRTKTTIIYHH